MQNEHAPTCTCRAHPFPAAMRVRDALDAYLAENGFTRAGYDAPRTPAAFFRLRFTVPNTPHHRWAIMLHDLHHVATGFGTDLAGEAEISGWELRRGLGDLDAYVSTIVGSAGLFGIVLAPRRTLRAFQSSAASDARSLFVRGVDYEALLAMTVASLRARLGLSEHGVVDGVRALHPDAPREGRPAS